jgi:flagellar hook-length control protein FliK
MAKKTLDPFKAKQRKQKIMAIVLGVIFVGVAAFEVPRVMKMMKTPPNPHANDVTSTTAAPTGTPSLAAPTLRGAEDPTGAPTGSLTSSDTPAMQDGQLASFSRFSSKDPFSQQLSDEHPATPSSGSSGSGSGSGSGLGSPTGVTSGPTTSPRPGSAVISVNGVLYTVATNGDFPQASAADPSAVPLFHLISLTAHSAKISIVGGSYSSGSPAVTLSENKAVTLVNTADGTRYTLILKPAGTNVPSGVATSSSGSSSSGSSSSATPASPTSTTVTLPSP